MNPDGVNEPLIKRERLRGNLWTAVVRDLFSARKSEMLDAFGTDAITQRDYPVIITLNFLVAVLTLIGTSVSDILYMVVDPRIKL